MWIIVLGLVLSHVSSHRWLSGWGRIDADVSHARWGLAVVSPAVTATSQGCVAPGTVRNYRRCVTRTYLPRSLAGSLVLGAVRNCHWYVATKCRCRSVAWFLFSSPRCHQELLSLWDRLVSFQECSLLFLLSFMVPLLYFLTSASLRHGPFLTILAWSSSASFLSTFFFRAPVRLVRGRPWHQAKSLSKLFLFWCGLFFRE